METMASSTQVVVVPRKCENHEIYVAAARGDMKQLEERRSEVGGFSTPVAKNTILHVYIIAQSRVIEWDMPTSPAVLLYIYEVGRKWCCFECPRDKVARLSEAAANNVGDMLELWPSLLWKVNAAEDTPLHMAARHGLVRIVKLLIDRTKSEERDVESGTMRVREMLHMVNKGKETALHQAVRYQHNKVVQLLVDEDDPDYKYSPNEDGETPLYMAAERGNCGIVKIIVDHYNFPAYEGPHGASALHAAAANFKAVGEAIVGKTGLEFLTTKVNERGRTPLHYGATYLLKHDHSAAFVKDKEGKTALHVLAGKGYDWIVREFLEECPECFELDDDRGRNALHYAVESGDEGTVEVIRKSEYFGDLLKKKDKEGLTPLHLLALKRFYMHNFIFDERPDRMAFDAMDRTPNDIILTKSTHSKIDMQLGDAMRYAGYKVGRRSENKMKINNFDQDQTHTNNKVIITKSRGDEEDYLKEDRQNHLVVAALIATVTFAAGFTLPGGYNQDDPGIGQAVLTKKMAFQAFVILNTLAMVLSSAAVFIHLLIAINKKNLRLHKADDNASIKPKKPEEELLASLRGTVEASDLFAKALPITLIAIVAMVLAFMAGTYAVLSHAPVLAIAACVTGSLFFGLFWYLWMFMLFKSALLVSAVSLYFLILGPATFPLSVVIVVLGLIVYLCYRTYKFVLSLF